MFCFLVGIMTTCLARFSIACYVKYLVPARYRYQHRFFFTFSINKDMLNSKILGTIFATTPSSSILDFKMAAIFIIFFYDLYFLRSYLKLFGITYL